MDKVSANTPTSSPSSPYFDSDFGDLPPLPLQRSPTSSSSSSPYFDPDLGYLPPLPLQRHVNVLPRPTVMSRALPRVACSGRCDVSLNCRWCQDNF